MFFQPTERKYSMKLSTRVCVGGNHTKTQSLMKGIPQTLDSGLLPINNPVKWCGLY